MPCAKYAVRSRVRQISRSHLHSAIGHSAEQSIDCRSNHPVSRGNRLRLCTTALLNAHSRHLNSRQI
jgi:hypothetical protein